MTPSEYMVQGLRTEHTRAYIVDENGDYDLKMSRIDHAAKGLNTEVAELAEALFAYESGKTLDRVNLVEEAGDVYWYSALMIRTLGVTFEEAAGRRDQNLMAYPGIPSLHHRVLFAQLGLTIEQGRIEDLLKKSAVYGKPLNREELIQRMGNILYYLDFLLTVALDSSMSEAMERNVAKLLIRYPVEFSKDKALNRDLAAERAALEGK